MFFDLSNAFDKVWKEELLVKLHKMYIWIQHFQQGLHGWSLMAPSTKKSVSVRGYLRVVFCLPHCSWSTLTTFLPPYQRVSQTHYTQTAWQSRMHLNTPPVQPTGSKKPSMVSIRGHWGFELNIGKTNNTLFSLSTPKKQIKLWL